MKLPKSTYIFLYLMGLVPIGLASDTKFNPFVVAALLIYLYVLIFSGPLRPSIMRDKTYGKPNLVMLLVLIGIIVPYLKLVVTDDRFASGIMLPALGYILFWVLLAEVKSFQDIEKLLSRVGLMVLAAAGLLLFFYYKPDVLNGLTEDAGMGTFRGYEQGFVRIFTPGMVYVAMAIIFLFCKLTFSVLTTTGKLYLSIAASIAFVILAVATSVRTYVIGIMLALAFLFVYRINIKKVVTFVAIVGLFLLVFISLPKDYSSYIAKRIEPVIGISSFDLGGALNNNPTYGRASYDTFYWRVAEARTALGQIDSASKVIFGSMGQTYSFGIYQSYAPHIGYVGLYYCFGALGVVAFSVFIVYFTAKIIRVIKLFRGSRYEYLSIFLLLAWVNLLIFAVAGPIFYAPESAILASICALAVIMEKLYYQQRARINENQKTENIDRNSLLQPG